MRIRIDKVKDKGDNWIMSRLPEGLGGIGMGLGTGGQPLLNVRQNLPNKGDSGGDDMAAPMGNGSMGGGMGNGSMGGGNMGGGAGGNSNALQSTLQVIAGLVGNQSGGMSGQGMGAGNMG